MKIRLAASLALLACATVAAPVLAQRAAPQELRFPRGATAVTLEGRAGRAPRLYTFRARAGQYLRIDMNSRADDVAADLRSARGRVFATTSEDGRMFTRLPYSGVYNIRVYRLGDGRMDRPSFYSMRVSIR